MNLDLIILCNIFCNINPKLIELVRKLSKLSNDTVVLCSTLTKNLVQASTHFNEGYYLNIYLLL